MTAARSIKAIRRSRRHGELWLFCVFENYIGGNYEKNISIIFGVYHLLFVLV
jgi:hypothetical protein